MICADFKDGVLETLNDCVDDSLVVFDYADFNYIVDSLADVALIFSFILIVNFMFCIYLFRKIK